MRPKLSAKSFEIELNAFSGAPMPEKAVENDNADVASAKPSKPWPIVEIAMIAAKLRCTHRKASIRDRASA